VTSNRRWLWTLAAVLVGGVAHAAEPGRGFLTREFTAVDGQTLKYALFVPHAYKPDTPAPVILFLHGVGEAGTDGDRPTRVGLGEYVRKHEATFPFVVVFPQAPRVPDGLLDQARVWWPGRPDGDRALEILARSSGSFGPTRNGCT